MTAPYDPRRPLHEALEVRGPGGEAVVRELVRTLGLHRRSRVLELGCGSGRTACQIAREVRCEVVATDLDPDCLEVTLARVLREKLSARFASQGNGLVRVRQADARSLFAFFPHTRFDAVIAENVVGLLGIEVVGPSVLAVLDDDGYFAYSVVGWRNPPDEIPEPIRTHWERLYPVPLYTLQENLERLSAAGFGRGFAYELDREAWEAYYGPLRERVQQLLSAGIRTSELEQARRELELWYEHDAHRHIAAWVLVGQPGENELVSSLLAAEIPEPGALEEDEPR
ncbi:MAG: class I SAM-dependent methyltransferase [Planctomycetota bacterium]|nr:MAG: class I SAM-dependent methyltransferase [Planctomycetota bacterium]